MSKYVVFETPTGLEIGWFQDLDTATEVVAEVAGDIEPDQDIQVRIRNPLASPADPDWPFNMFVDFIMPLTTLRKIYTVTLDGG